MNDHDFLQQFETCTLPKEHFTHRGHLRVTWLYLEKYTYHTAARAVRAGIIKYATSLGAAQIFHETMTQVWIQLVAGARIKNNAATFDEFMTVNPELSNSKLIHEYYSTAVLQSKSAKTAWQAPDLKPLPVGIDQFR